MYVYAVFLLVRLRTFSGYTMETSIDPGEWEWKIVRNKYVPVITDKVPTLILS